MQPPVREARCSRQCCLNAYPACCAAPPRKMSVSTQHLIVRSGWWSVHTRTGFWEGLSAAEESKKHRALKSLTFGILIAYPYSVQQTKFPLRNKLPKKFVLSSKLDSSQISSCWFAVKKGFWKSPGKLTHSWDSAVFPVPSGVSMCADASAKE